ncbi:guanylate kinase [Bacteroidia bacterium]|nr:guanylate kinase [Bacteroidia bacterium]
MQKALIFSAPSGSGKTTVVNHLLKTMPETLAFSISVTTRKPRPNEEHGREYYFLSEEEFKSKLAEDAFVEHEMVYQGLYYGTLKTEVERLWAEGKCVLFDVDVKGGLNLKKQFGTKAKAIFLKPPSIEILMDRLTKRSTEVEHMLKERIAKAKEELSFEDQYDVVLENDVLGETLKNAEALVKNFLDQ